MNKISSFFRYATTTAIILFAALKAYTQSDKEIVSYFVKEQLEVKENQTIFNVLNIENKTDSLVKLQVNFTLPTDWEMFNNRTHYLDIEAHQKIALPIRISPSEKAKGGIGYALNASLLSTDGTTIANRYCFLTVPVKTKLDLKYSAISYYLDHRYGRANISLNVKNNGNSHKLLGLKLSCDDHIEFSENGQNIYNAELSLSPGQDTTIVTRVRYDDMIENIKYFNRPIIAELTANDTTITNYSFLKYLDYKYENEINDANQPLVLEVSALDLLSETISFRILAMGKLKFRKNKSLSYYYRSLSAPLKELPNWDYDEYYVKYSTSKHSIEAGNIHDYQRLSIFGRGARYTGELNNKTKLTLSAIDDIYSANYAFTGRIERNIGKCIVNAEYTKMISDTSHSNYLDMCGLGIRTNLKSLGYINVSYTFNQYSDIWNSKKGHSISIDNSNHITKKLSYNIIYRNTSPYSAIFDRGRNYLYTNTYYYMNKRSWWHFNYNRYEYKPASIYNDWSTDLNYKIHTFRLLYNYMITNNSNLYMGPNYDYGTSNYYDGQKTDLLALSSIKTEFGYKYSPNLYSLQSININIQFGQMNPNKYDYSIYSDYTKMSNVLKFSATIQGHRWGVYGMYYSGLYNMNIALTNFYTNTAGKYLYFMPYLRVTTANKMFYYEIRFSYLNNIDLKSNRTGIMQEAGANFNGGWSLRLQNNTNIQALQDATGQSYRYTNNYMEFTVRKVFGWNQPGQKYHTLKTVFYRDLDGNRTKGPNEPNVENVVMNIDNLATRDSSYHFEGEMFGNIDVASNYNGQTIYKNIPEARYHLSFSPTDDQTERFNLEKEWQDINLTRDTTIYIPFVERNLVFGVVKFNRAKRSALQELKLDGIKVSITDSRGQAWYAFTDQNGYYEIFAPSADFYKVQIVNNIWSQYFDIRQDAYIIKFNGYKRFEVNFEFDEKKREIIFTDLVDINDIVGDDKFKYEKITQIKQTILRGTVSDESNLHPLIATVEIFDVRSHEVIAKIKSNENGSFYTTFMSGNSYQLRISAPGYWIHKENLYDEQLSTFESIVRDGLMLKKIEINEPINLNNMTFATNSDELSPEAKAELDQVVVLLANNPNVHINIAGYCSKDEKNPKTLSSNRARNVVEYITYHGIEYERITFEGRSAKDDNNPEENQKVELIVTKIE